MNWIQQNKLLSAYLALVAAGLVALGFLAFQKGRQYADTSEEYGRQAAELRRLQGLKPFPAQENLVKLQEQHGGFAQEIENLQKTLASLVTPHEPSSPDAFQAELREMRDALIAEATKVGTALPENFYLGFDTYQVKLPANNEAAGALLRELRVVDLLMRILLKEHVDQIVKVKLQPLPEELAKPQASSTGKTGKDARRAADPESAQPQTRGKAEPRNLVNRHPIDITFVADNEEYRRAFNEILKAKQFFVVRLLRVENSQPKGPRRETPTPATPEGAPATPGQPGLPGQPADAVAPPPPPPDALPGDVAVAPGQYQILAGREKVTVTARIEYVTLPYAAQATTPQR